MTVVLAANLIMVVVFVGVLILLVCLALSASDIVPRCIELSTPANKCPSCGYVPAPHRKRCGCGDKEVT